MQKIKEAGLNALFACPERKYEIKIFTRIYV